MGKSERERLGKDVFERRRLRGSPDSGASSLRGADGNNQPGAVEPHPNAVYELLVWWGSLDGGWLKISPDFTGNCLWLLWKYTGPQWTGCYILYRANIGDLLSGLEGLRIKYYEVERGARLPTKDKWRPGTAGD